MEFGCYLAQSEEQLELGGRMVAEQSGISLSLTAALLLGEGYLLIKHGFKKSAT